MFNVLAVYRGSAPRQLELIASSSDQELVADVAWQLLQREQPAGDKVLDSIHEGRREALAVIAKGASR